MAPPSSITCGNGNIRRACKHLLESMYLNAFDGRGENNTSIAQGNYEKILMIMASVVRKDFESSSRFRELSGET